MEQTKSVAIRSIRPDPNQPRKFISPDHIDGLAKSLRSVGLINPIELDDNNMIVTGEARWLAAKRLKWKEIAARYIDAGTGPERFLRQVSENLHQGSIPGGIGMQPMDAARAFERLLDEEEAGLLGDPIPVEECECCINFVRAAYEKDPRGRPAGGMRSLHRRIGRPPMYISERLGFLDEERTPPPVREALEDGRLNHTMGRTIIAAPKGWKLPVLDRILKAQEEDKPIQTRAVRAVTGAIGKVEDKPTQKRLLNVLTPGKTEPQAKKEIAEIAPSVTEVLAEIDDAGRILRNLNVLYQRKHDELLGRVAKADQRELYQLMTITRDQLNQILEGRPEATIIEGRLVASGNQR